MRHLIINKYLFLGFLLIYLIYHAVTLEVSPIPWYDEVCLASESLSYLNTGKISLTIYPWLYSLDKEILQYGPIYFMLTKFSLSFFGFGIFQFRMVNLLAGLLSIWISYRILKLFIPNKNALYLFVVLISTDAVLFQNMHSGRMDLVALFPVLCAVYLLFKNLRDLKMKYVGGVSLLVSMAMLTTPRVIFFTIAIGFYIVYIHHKNLNKLTLSILLYGGILGFVYCAWIYIAFGDISNFLNYYSSNATLNAHIGGNFYIQKIQYPLVAIFLLFSMIGLLKLVDTNKKIFIVFAVGTIILFYLIVFDYGLYSVFILPFYYISIFILISTISIRYNRLKPIIGIILLIAINVSSMVFKGLYIGVFYNERNNRELTERFRSLLKPNSNLLGEDRFFYASELSDCSFESFSEGDLKSIIEYYKSNEPFDYLVISDEFNERRPYYFEEFSNNFPLEVFAKVNLNERDSYLRKLVIDNFKVSNSASLNCTIYKRVQ